MKRTTIYFLKTKVVKDFNNIKSYFVVYLVLLQGLKCFNECHRCRGQVGGVGSDIPLQQASSTGVKQIVLRLSGLRQPPATSGEPSVKYGGMRFLSSLK